MNAPPPGSLFDKLFDGALTPAEREQLANRLVRDPAAADEFARAARLHAGLEAIFSQAAAIERQRSLALQISSLAASELALRQRKQSRVAWLVAAAALVLAVTLGWLASGRRQPGGIVTREESQLVSGRLLISGKPADEVVALALPADAPLAVADDQPATIRLADGSRAELEPESVAVLHEPTGAARQVVEIQRGTGTFFVAQGRGEFQVQTPAGRVTALGTEFSVHVSSSRPSGESEMRIPSLLLVTVLSGLVQVDVGGVVHSLAGGDSFLFAEEGSKQPAVRGLVVAIDPAGRGITLDGVKKEGTEVSPPQKYTIAADAKVTIAGEAKTLADVKAGDRVQLSLAADKQTVTVIAVGAAKKEGGEKEGDKKKSKVVTGVLGKIEGSQLTVTIRNDSGERTETATLAANSRIDIQTAQDEIVKGEGGEDKKTRKIVAGTAAELKVGQRVAVQISETGEVIKIMVLYIAPKKSEGEQR